MTDHRLVTYKIYMKMRFSKELQQQGTDSTIFQDNFIQLQ